MRSAAAKSLRLRAASRSAMRSAIHSSDTPAGARLQELVRLALQQAEDAAEGLQLRRGAAVALEDAVGKLNSSAIASGVPKSSSIASLKRCACGSFQSTGRTALDDRAARCTGA